MFSFLFPQPDKIHALGGSFNFAGVTFALPLREWDGVPVHLAANARLAAASRATRTSPVVAIHAIGETSAKANAHALNAVPFATRDSALLSGAYRLEVSPASGLRIHAADAAGLLYALQSFAQLLHHFGAKIPALACVDAPAFPVRGFMLDISRCKVPTQAALQELVSQLAFLRINQLQLYTEHTYAFAGHREVWLGASPMTAADYASLRSCCVAHAIDLVPNLQSFGHAERWLKHRRYRHLAECPDGFYHDLAAMHRPPGTFRPCPESLRFVTTLHDEFLPNFPIRDNPSALGTAFNIGGDEPWELGLGASRERCTEFGKHAVYCEHLAALAQSVEARGRRAQFWADILLEPEGLRHAATLPASAIPVLWGYDAGHPFEQQCATLAATGRDYLVAPGASTWQTLHGRLDNALANIREATAAALAHNARGVLLTSWGDNGNHQPWSTFFPALAAASALAWNPRAHAGESSSPESAVLQNGIAAAFFNHIPEPAGRLLRLGVADRFFTKSIRNKSLLWELLVAPRQSLEQILPGIPECEISAALRHLETTLANTPATALADMVSGVPNCAEKSSIPAVIPNFRGVLENVESVVKGVPALELECAATLALARLATCRARAVRAGVFQPRRSAPLRHSLRAALALYRAAWRRRAREGGLLESLAKLTAPFSEA